MRFDYGSRVLHIPTGREGEVEGADYIGTEDETILVFFDNGDALHADPSNLQKANMNPSHREIYVSKDKNPDSPFSYQGQTTENDKDAIKSLLEGGIIELGDRVLLVAQGETAGLYQVSLSIEWVG
jgi:hypothetical protein